MSLSSRWRREVFCVTVLPKARNGTTAVSCCGVRLRTFSFPRERQGRFAGLVEVYLVVSGCQEARGAYLLSCCHVCSCGRRCRIREAVIIPTSRWRGWSGPRSKRRAHPSHLRVPDDISLRQHSTIAAHLCEYTSSPTWARAQTSGQQAPTRKKTARGQVLQLGGSHDVGCQRDEGVFPKRGNGLGSNLMLHPSARRAFQGAAAARSGISGRLLPAYSSAFGVASEVRRRAGGAGDGQQDACHLHAAVVVDTLLKTLKSSRRRCLMSMHGSPRRG